MTGQQNLTVLDVFLIRRCKLDESFTPKQVASALQVSESSVKRWCDRGVIRTDRTIGGHRRIPLEFLLEFLESTNRRVVEPSAIGLKNPSNQEHNEGVANNSNRESMKANFETALLAGDEVTCRRILSTWYATHGGIVSVSDELLSPIFRSVGEQWECGSVEIYQERRGCELCNRLIHELRRLIQEPEGFAHLAMGGAVSGDGSQIPSQLIEMVFREQGWRTAYLGANLPLSTMLSAARKHMPRVFWLSVTHIEDTESFLSEFAHFSKSLPKGIMLVVGGRLLKEGLREKMSFSAHCDNMLQLSNLARSLRVAPRPLNPQI